MDDVYSCEQVRFTIMEEAQGWTYNRIDENEKLAGYAKTDLRLDYDFGYGVSANALLITSSINLMSTLKVI